jgi:hypothetical protein
MNGKKMKEDMVIISKTYDFILDITERVRKFPREYKFVLGERILENIYNILDEMIMAVYQKDKINLLKKINIRIEQLRFQIRLAKDYKIITIKQYEYVSGNLNEIGKMTGGWIKSL